MKIKETAIEIGKSCKLIQEDMKIIILSSKSLGEFKGKINEACKEFV